jgi:two-component system chemotaxis response regulator CheY
MSGRILIVHAAGVMRMMVRNNLIASGYDVVGEGVSGTEAVEMYRTLRPDLMTMDMVLPELDCVAAVKAIVAEFPLANIVVCASIGQPDLLVEALRAGAKSFITKPFGPSKFSDVISNVLA